MCVRAKIAFIIAVGFIVISGQQALARDPVVCDYGKNGTFESAQKYRVFRLHERSDLYKYFDENCDGKITYKQRAAYNAWLNEDVDIEVQLFEQRQRAGVATPTPDQTVPPVRQAGGWRKPAIILRETYDDMRIFSEPQKRKDAKGALFSYANDREAGNSIWTAKGVLALPFSWSNPNPTEGKFNPSLAGFAFTPLVGFNRVGNSNSAIGQRNNVDILSLGGGGEVALGNIFDETTTHHFKGRAAYVTSFAGAQRSWNSVAEYQPYTAFPSGLNLSAPSPFLFPYWNIVFSPTLRLHYAEKERGGTDPLFDERDNVLRAGSSANVSVYTDQGDGVPVPKWLQKAMFSVSYNWLQDVRTRKNYEYLNTGITFALDDKGDVALKISYEKGRIEETGQPIDLAKVGITVRQ